MNAIDAAAKVLAEAGKPLSYREITRACLLYTSICSLVVHAGMVFA